jgi:hypothetical protein
MHLPTLEIPHKRCPNCGVTKPWSAFSSQHLREFRPSSYCRKCQRAYCKAHYRRNRDLHNSGRYQRAKRERRQKREYIWRYLDNHPCVDCGEADIVVLEFDHVTGTKDGEISTLVASNASYERLVRELAKCVVRCANCHRRKTATQFSWKVAQRYDTELPEHGR